MVAPVPLALRVVEVIAEFADGNQSKYRYGSGCIVAGGTVLTAAHVVAGARNVHVRDANKVMHSATVDERFVGDETGPGPDLALIEVDGLTTQLASMTLAAVDRSSIDAKPVHDCHAVGYPWFAERPAPTAVRDTADVYGYVPVLSKLASGLLSLQASSPPRPLPPQDASLSESEWSGMSGAPVVADGCLLGVVTEHAPREGPGTITFTSLTALQPDPAHPRWGPGVADPSSWWARLGVAGLSALRPLPRRRNRPQPSYRATVREIQARTECLGRQRELDEIAAFATGPEGYLWLIGGAWAGKTALLAAAAKELSEHVQIVAYFLSRVQADADSNRFLAAAVPQLADLLDEDTGVADIHQFRSLWQAAAEAAAASRRHLLLIVDGLDEDLHPAATLSVAALLPAISGGHAHVLVSSRPYPELPADIPARHPLRTTQPRALTPFAGAEELAAFARQEIDDLKRRDDGGLAIDILATLTAAAGPLTVHDLAVLSADTTPLTPAHTRRVRRLITVDAGRSLQPVGQAAAQRYQFAHPSLLEYARTDEDLCDPEYWQRIHRWAEKWKAAGWPNSLDGTPRYLLEAYPVRLADDLDHPARPDAQQRLSALASDIEWVISTVACVGVESVLASLRTAAQVIHSPTRAAIVLRLLELQAHNLYSGNANRNGYVATALAWEASRLNAADIARAASSMLEELPAPQIMPIWTSERRNPNLVTVLGRHGGRVEAMAVTAEGNVISAGYSGRILLWDPRAPGRSARELARQAKPVRALAVVPEGQVVSAADDGLLLVSDPAFPDRPARELARHGSRVTAITSTPTGQVITAGSGLLLVSDPAFPDRPARELARNAGWVTALTVTPGGQLVSADSNGLLLVSDPAFPDRPARELAGHGGTVTALTVTPGGQVVSAGEDGLLLVSDPAFPDRPARELARHGSRVAAITSTPTGQVITAGSGLLLVSDPAFPDRPARELARNAGWVTALTVTPGGQLVSADSDGLLLLWDTTTGNDSVHESLPYPTASAVAATSNGQVICGGDDGVIRAWDPADPDRPARELVRHNHGISAIATTRDGRIVFGSAGGTDGATRLWDPEKPDRPVLKLGQRDFSSGMYSAHTVSAIAVTADGRAVVSGGSTPGERTPYDRTKDTVGIVRMWDLTQPEQPIHELRHFQASVTAVTVGNDGTAIFGDADGLVWLWDPVLGRQRILTIHSGSVRAVLMTPDGLVLSAGEDGAVRLWDPAIPDQRGRELGRHDGAVRTLVITPGGLVLSAGSDGAVRLWDPAMPDQPAQELARHDKGVVALGLTTESKLLWWAPDSVTIFSMTTT